MNDESLDLRIPIQFILRHWRWVVLVAALSGLAALAITLAQPRYYQAEATLLISQSRTEVQFDPRIVTLADYELSRGTAESRREALVALVSSNEVVQAVLADVEHLLEPEERDIGWLRDVIAIQTAGDLINLEIRHRDPEIATAIANRWVEQYEQHVNQIYSSNITDSRIADQVAQAWERYSLAQEALEMYEATNPTEVLQRELDARTAVLENFQDARIASQTMPGDRNQEILSSYYRELAQIESWMANARALRDQVSDDTGSSAGNLGNALALIMLRSQVFGGNNDAVVVTEGEIVTRDAGIGLQMQLADLSAEPVRPQDVDALITTLEKRQLATQGRIDNFLQGLQDGDDTVQLVELDERITAVTTEVTSLRSQIEAATAEQRELTQSRDSAWDTYQVLEGRQVEEQIASQFASSEVRIADRATSPAEPVSRGVIRNTILASFASAILAMGILLAYAFWSIDDIADARQPQSDAVPAVAADEEIATEGASGVHTSSVPKTLSS